MGFFSNLFRKESRALSLVSIAEQGQPKSTPKNYDAMSKQGYELNIIVYDAINTVSQAMGELNWLLYQRNARGERQEVIVHPVLSLLRRPNPMQSKAVFFSSLASYYCISGNIFIESVRGAGKEYKELWPIPPSKFKIIPGTRGFPQKYIFTAKGESISFDVDQLTGKSDILHIKTFNPTNDWWGLSPLEPSMLSIDGHNAAQKHNLGLLQNGARPSGAIKITKEYAGSADGMLTEEAFENLKAEIKENWQGTSNAGKVAVLEGGMDWQPLAMDMADLNWLEGTNLNARNIALALGVPPILLHIPGDSTYNNVREARLALYEKTIIPLAKKFRDELNRHLFDENSNLELDIDMDAIEALNPKREAKFKQYQEVDFLTPNEKREALGYDPIEGGDKLKDPGASPMAALSPPPPPANEPPPPQKQIEQVIVVEEIHPPMFSKEIKQINLITKHEKQETARQLNNYREFYANNLQKELLSDYFDKITDDLKAIETIEKRFAVAQALRIVDQYDDELKGMLARMIKRTAEVFGQPIIDGGKDFWGQSWEVKKESDFLGWIEMFLADRSEKAAIIIKDTTLAQTKRIIEEEVTSAVQAGESYRELGKNISSRFKQISEARAVVIARTEVAIASNQSSMEAAKSLDIPDLKKEWVSVQDTRTRRDPTKADHLHMNGKRVGINEKFVVDPGVEMDGPLDPTAPAAQVVNCRCVMVFSRS